MPLPRLFQRGSRYTSSSLDFVAAFGNSIAKSLSTAQTSTYLTNYSKLIMEQGPRYTNPLNIIAQFRYSIANGSLHAQISAFTKNFGKRVVEFFKQPRESKRALLGRRIAKKLADIRKLILTYGVTSVAVFAFVACLGFGPLGVGGGLFP